MKRTYRDSILAYVGNPMVRDSSGKMSESVGAFQHRMAADRRYTSTAGRAVRSMLEGWADYADTHRSRNDSGIGDDYVLGDHWASIGMSIKRLLDGDVGGWDCGSLSHNIGEILACEGYNPETGERA